MVRVPACVYMYRGSGYSTAVVVVRYSSDAPCTRSRMYASTIAHTHTLTHTRTHTHTHSHIHMRTHVRYAHLLVHTPNVEGHLLVGPLSCPGYSGACLGFLIA